MIAPRQPRPQHRQRAVERRATQCTNVGMQ
jgi:hypothetical protein